jgi:hypothetical protein
MSDYPSTDSIMSELEQKPVETTATETPSASPEAAKSPWDEDEYTIEGGRKIREPREMILKRAGMGYHYAQQMHAINQEREKYKGYDEKIQGLSRWQEYDDFARTNPEWARHVEEAWNNRQNLQQSNQDQQSPHTAFEQKIAALEQRIAERDARDAEAAKAQQYAQEDKEFTSEISETAKKFEVDLSQADEQGRSLEWRVLEHMASMGLDGSKPGHFRAAFKDYYLDNLLDRQKEQVLEKTAKTGADMRKAGILGVSRTPQSAKSFNPRQHSYNELAEMALADLQKGG